MPEQFQVFFTKFAVDDLTEILDYFLQKNPEYIKKLLGQIESRLKELENFPKRGRVVPELEKKSITDYRELIEGNYRIVFQIKDRTVNVLSIIDGRRNLEELILAKLMRIQEGNA